MARLGDLTGAKRLESSTMPSVAFPFTMGCFFKPTTATGSTAFGLGRSGATNDYFALGHTGGNGFFEEGATGQDSTGGAVTLNRWNHVAAIALNATSRTVYVNGVAGTANTASYTPTALNRITLTGVYINTYGSQATGSIAEAFIYEGVALTTAEMANLGKVGVTPNMVRPEALSHYWPLYGGHDPEVDIGVVGGINLVITNAPLNIDHPFEYPDLNLQEPYM